MPLIIIRRLRDLAIMILLVPLLTVTMLEFTPGSYCNFVLPDHVSLETRQACHAEYEVGIGSKYWRTLRNATQGHLGYSLNSHRPIAKEIVEQFTFTFNLGLLSFVVAIVFGTCGGIIAAQKRHAYTGKLLNWAGISAISLPSFIVALLLLKVFAVQLGMVSILGSPNQWEMMVLPVAAISLPLSAWFLRVTRNAIVDVLSEDYIRTATAKGIADRKIFLNHAFRNALGIVIPFSGIVLAGLLDGTLIVEIIMNRPGLGRYTLDAVITHDYPALQGVIILTVTITVLVNMVSDLLYFRLFPLSRDSLRVQGTKAI